MPRSDSVDPKKRRVRTGCLTCRRRRRKCDEKKPKCVNCSSKGLECRYGVNIVFVDEYGSRSAALSDVPVATPKDHQLPPTESLPVRQNNEELPCLDEHDFAYFDSEDVSHNQSSNVTSPPSRLHSQPIQNETGLYASPTNAVQVSQSTVSVNFSSPTSHRRSFNVPTPTPSTASEASQQRFLPPAATIRLTTSFHRSSLAVGKRSPTELDLLCIYRYHIGPWLDIGDPSCHFGIKVALAALDSPPLHKIILALSRVKLLICPHLGSNIYAVNHLETTSTINAARLEQAALTNHIPSLSLLLLTAEMLITEPANWGQLVRSSLSSLTNNQTAPIYLTLGEAELWVVLRFDLAAALLSNTSPSVSWQTFSLLRHAHPGSTPSDFFLTSLSLLAQAVTLVHPLEGGRRHSSEVPVASRWSALWNENQTWYATRPILLQQILDIPALELDELEHSTTSSHSPGLAIIFSSSMALLANAVYHITCLLLLSHKPRLLKAKAQATSAGSPLWHAQRIAAIAVSCHEPHSWDPLLIAGLILAAARMSHDVQRKNIVDALTRAQEFTGMKLEKEIEKLQASTSENYSTM